MPRPEIPEELIDFIIKSLGKALQYDNDGQVQWRAAKSLGSIIHNNSLRILTETFRKHPDWHVRELSAKTLGEMKVESVVNVLLESLKKDPEIKVREAAIEALLQINHLGTVVETTLIDLLDREDIEEHFQVVIVSSLGKMRSKLALSRILEKLEEDSISSELKVVLIDSLGHIRDNRALEKIVSLIRMKSQEVREAAVNALGLIGGEKAGEILIELLREDSDFQVRARAAASLGKLKIRHDEVINLLIDRLINEEFPLAREACAQALGEIGTGGGENDDVMRALEFSVSKDKDFGVRESAAEALGKLGENRATRTLIKASVSDSDSYVRNISTRSLSTMNLDVSDVVNLQSLLEDSNPEIRRRVIRFLGTLEDFGQVEWLSQKLRTDPLTGVREEITRAIGKLLANKDDQLAIEVLHRVLLEDPSWTVRYEVAICLGMMAPTFEAREALLEAMKNDPDPMVRRVAAESLAQYGKMAEDSLLKLLKESQDESQRENCIEALGRLKSQKTIPIFLEILKTSHSIDLRWQAAVALGEVATDIYNPQDIRRMINSLQETLAKDPVAGIRAVSAWALGKMHTLILSEMLIDPLLKALRTDKNFNVREVSGETLGIIGTEKALKALGAALEEDIDPSVRYCSAAALGIALTGRERTREDLSVLKGKR